MSYRKSIDGDLITIELVCEARKGKGVCGSTAEVTMQSLEMVNKFLFALGWRLLRGKQVCGSCMMKYPKIVFPRVKARG